MIAQCSALFVTRQILKQSMSKCSKKDLDDGHYLQNDSKCWAGMKLGVNQICYFGPVHSPHMHYPVPPNYPLLHQSMVSSANLLTHPSTPSSRSLIKITNSRGPSTDPCGTPLVTGLQAENLPSTTTSLSSM